MNRFVSFVLIDGFALWVAVQLVPGIHLPGKLINVLLALLLFGIMSVLMRPIFAVLSFPLILITSGLLRLLLNAAQILLCALLAEFLGLNFIVEGVFSALTAAVTVSLVRMVIMKIVRIGKKKMELRKEQINIFRLKSIKIGLEKQINQWERIAKSGRIKC